MTWLAGGLREERRRRSNLVRVDCFAEFILSLAEGLAMTAKRFLDAIVLVSLTGPIDPSQPKL